MQLRVDLQALLPGVDLPQSILEIHLETVFLDEFTHLSEGNARVDDSSIARAGVDKRA